MLFRPTSAALLATALLFIRTVSASHVETFSDSSCQTEIHQWNGPNGYPNGQCTAVSRQGNYTSFKISSLDYGCAITIYGPGTQAGPCDSNAAPGAIVAVPGKCYNTTWAFYSIDGCKNQVTKSHSTSSTSSKSTSTHSTLSKHTTAGSTASSAPAAPSATESSQQHHSSVNIGAIVGGVIGGVAFGVIVAAIGIVAFIRYRRIRRNRPPQYPGDGPGSTHGLADVAAKELPEGAYYTGSRPGTARSEPGTPSDPVELSHEGIPEMPSYPLAELPSRDYGMDIGTKSMTVRTKE